MSQTIQRLNLSLIDPDPQPFKKGMAERFLNGLRASLDEFGYVGTMTVAPQPNGRFLCCDGNTRLAELRLRDIAEVACDIRDDLSDPDRRRLFQITYDRHKKPYDEAELTKEMERLQSAYPLERLATLTARLDMVAKQTFAPPHDVPNGAGADGGARPVISHEARNQAPRPAPRASTIDYAILSLAGPSDLIDEIKLMLPKRLDHLRSLRRIREAFDEPTPLDDDDYVTLLIHDALRLRQWRGGEP